MMDDFEIEFVALPRSTTQQFYANDEMELSIEEEISQVIIFF